MFSIAQAFTRFTIAGTLALTLASLGGVSSVAAASSTRAPASVKVGILPSTPEDAAGLTAYTITASNDGENAAGEVTISVPYDSAALRFVGATFSQPSAWISNNTANALEIKTGSVGGDGGSVKAVLRFQPLSNAGAQAVQRLAFTWTDKLKGGHGISNLLPSAGAPGGYLPLSINQSADSMSFDSNAFASNEGVYFWYNAPDGTVIPTRVQRGKLINANLAELKYRDNSDYQRGSEYAIADDQGQVGVAISTDGLAPGTYTLVAHGNSSGLTAVATLQVR
jgi:hypothetical protein